MVSQTFNSYELAWKCHGLDQCQLLTGHIGLVLKSHNQNLWVFLYLVMMHLILLLILIFTQDTDSVMVMSCNSKIYGQNYFDGLQKAIFIIQTHSIL